MTCLLGVVELFILLGVEQGLHDMVSRAVTCIAGRGAGSSRFLHGVKGFGDVLAGRGAGFGRVVWCQGRR